MLPYDLIPFTARDEDGFTRVWCSATWTPRGGGATRSATGDHLDPCDGKPALLCGIYAACDDLDLPAPDDDYALLISDLIDRQLALSPKAELWCPEGHLVVELVEPPRE